MRSSLARGTSGTQGSEWQYQVKKYGVGGWTVVCSLEASHCLVCCVASGLVGSFAVLEGRSLVDHSFALRGGGGFKGHGRCWFDRSGTSDGCCGSSIEASWEEQ
jgi:hypothetical protein